MFERSWVGVSGGMEVDVMCVLGQGLGGEGGML